MDPIEQIKITISTHNVNGFTRNKDFLHTLCESNPDAIRAIQEHWLKPPFKKQLGVNNLRSLHPNFDGFGTSAMKHAVESRIVKGRPFGGTGFLFNKKFANCLKPLLDYAHERVTVMKLDTMSFPILLINVYFPYFNSRDQAIHMSMYRDTLGFVENIMSQNPDCKFMILADLNCNIYDTAHPFSKLIRETMEKFDLVSSFDLNPNFDYNSSFTRSDIKTNSYTLIDGILISSELSDSVSDVRILIHGDNLSDHCPVELELQVNVSQICIKKTVLPQYVNWKKLTDLDKTRFEDAMRTNLALISVPFHSILHGDKCCFDDSHKVTLEQYYCNIMSAVVKAESVLPKTNPNFERSFWDDDLSELKTRSIECNNYWKSVGCPKSGPDFDCRKACHYKYKAAVRRKKKSTEKMHNDKMKDDLLNKDSVAFWKSWKKMNGSRESTATRISGKTEAKDIADTFASYFESVYGDHETPEHEALKKKFEEKYAEYFSQHKDNVISPHFLSWSEMMDIVAKIKPGKSSSGTCKPEHILFGSPVLICHLQLLFNGLIQHGYAPTDFLKGSITPIVKNPQGDISDPSNYRGITLSCLPAKLFEFAIQLKTSHLLETDDLQFGFKKKTSTGHALFSLKTTVNHFNDNGSNVYAAFLDCTKAFDRISHFGLFTKLMERSIPLCILLCLIYWYINMICNVKWENEISRSFKVPLGIKQGGINSPEFFGCYIDDIASILRNLNIGCHIFGIFLAMILFADDILLLAPTRNALQKMIHLCAAYCKEFGLTFNASKSKIIVFSKTHIDNANLSPILLNGRKIEYVDSVIYLGTTIVNNRGISFSCSNDLSKFYRASNSILRAVNKPSEEVLMQLLYTCCIPILSYASAVKLYPSRQMQDCSTAVNDALRLIFGFNRWESVRTLRESFGYKSLVDLFGASRSKFDASLVSHRNPVISHLARNLVVDS